MAREVRPTTGSRLPVSTATTTSTTTAFRVPVNARSKSGLPTRAAKGTSSAVPKATRPTRAPAAKPTTSQAVSGSTNTTAQPTPKGPAASRRFASLASSSPALPQGSVRRPPSPTINFGKTGDETAIWDVAPPPDMSSTGLFSDDDPDETVAGPSRLPALGARIGPGRMVTPAESLIMGGSLPRGKAALAPTQSTLAAARFPTPEESQARAKRPRVTSTPRGNDTIAEFDVPLRDESPARAASPPALSASQIRFRQEVRVDEAERRRSAASERRSRSPTKELANGTPRAAPVQLVLTPAAQRILRAKASTVEPLGVAPGKDPLNLLRSEMSVRRRLSASLSRSTGPASVKASAKKGKKKHPLAQSPATPRRSPAKRRSSGVSDADDTFTGRSRRKSKKPKTLPALDPPPVIPRSPSAEAEVEMPEFHPPSEDQWNSPAPRSSVSLAQSELVASPFGLGLARFVAGRESVPLEDDQDVGLEAAPTPQPPPSRKARAARKSGSTINPKSAEFVDSSEDEAAAAKPVAEPEPAAESDDEATFRATKFPSPPRSPASDRSMTPPPDFDDFDAPSDAGSPAPEPLRERSLTQLNEPEKVAPRAASSSPMVSNNATPSSVASPIVAKTNSPTSAKSNKTKSPATKRIPGLTPEASRILRANGSTVDSLPVAPGKDPLNLLRNDRAALARARASLLASSPPRSSPPPELPPLSSPHREDSVEYEDYQEPEDLDVGSEEEGEGEPLAEPELEEEDMDEDDEAAEEPAPAAQPSSSPQPSSPARAELLEDEELQDQDDLDMGAESEAEEPQQPEDVESEPEETYRSPSPSAALGATVSQTMSETYVSRRSAAAAKSPVRTMGSETYISRQSITPAASSSPAVVSSPVAASSPASSRAARPSLSGMGYRSPTPPRPARHSVASRHSTTPADPPPSALLVDDITGDDTLIVADSSIETDPDASTRTAIGRTMLEQLQAVASSPSSTTPKRSPLQAGSGTGLSPIARTAVGRSMLEQMRGSSAKKATTSPAKSKYSPYKGYVSPPSPTNLSPTATDHNSSPKSAHSSSPVRRFTTLLDPSDEVEMEDVSISDGEGEEGEEVVMSEKAKGKLPERSPVKLPSIAGSPAKAPHDAPPKPIAFPFGSTSSVIDWRTLYMGPAPQAEDESEGAEADAEAERMETEQLDEEELDDEAVMLGNPEVYQEQIEEDAEEFDEEEVPPPAPLSVAKAPIDWRALYLAQNPGFKEDGDEDDADEEDVDDNDKENMPEQPHAPFPVEDDFDAEDDTMSVHDDSDLRDADSGSGGEQTFDAEGDTVSLPDSDPFPHEYTQPGVVRAASPLFVGDSDELDIEGDAASVHGSELMQEEDGHADPMRSSSPVDEYADEDEQSEASVDASADTADPEQSGEMSFDTHSPSSVAALSPMPDLTAHRSFTARSGRGSRGLSFGISSIIDAALGAGMTLDPESEVPSSEPVVEPMSESVSEVEVRYEETSIRVMRGLPSPSRQVAASPAREAAPTTPLSSSPEPEEPALPEDDQPLKVRRKKDAGITPARPRLSAADVSAARRESLHHRVESPLKPKVPSQVEQWAPPAWASASQARTASPLKASTSTPFALAGPSSPAVASAISPARAASVTQMVSRGSSPVDFAPVSVVSSAPSRRVISPSRPASIAGWTPSPQTAPAAAVYTPRASTSVGVGASPTPRRNEVAFPSPAGTTAATRSSSVGERPSSPVLPEPFDLAEEAEDEPEVHPFHEVADDELDKEYDERLAQRTASEMHEGEWPAEESSDPAEEPEPEMELIDELHSMEPIDEVEEQDEVIEQATEDGAVEVRSHRGTPEVEMQDDAIEQAIEDGAVEVRSRHSTPALDLPASPRRSSRLATPEPTASRLGTPAASSPRRSPRPSATPTRRSARLSATPVPESAVHISITPVHVASPLRHRSATTAVVVQAPSSPSQHSDEEAFEPEPEAEPRESTPPQMQFRAQTPQRSSSAQGASLSPSAQISSPVRFSGLSTGITPTLSGASLAAAMAGAGGVASPAPAREVTPLAQAATTPSRHDMARSMHHGASLSMSPERPTRSTPRAVAPAQVANSWSPTASSPPVAPAASSPRSANNSTATFPTSLSRTFSASAAESARAAVRSPLFRMSRTPQQSPRKSTLGQSSPAPAPDSPPSESTLAQEVGPSPEVTPKHPTPQTTPRKQAVPAAASPLSQTVRASSRASSVRSPVVPLPQPAHTTATPSHAAVPAAGFPSSRAGGSPIGGSSKKAATPSSPSPRRPQAVPTPTIRRARHSASPSPGPPEGDDSLMADVTQEGATDMWDISAADLTFDAQDVTSAVPLFARHRMTEGEGDWDASRIEPVVQRQLGAVPAGPTPLRFVDAAEDDEGYEEDAHDNGEKEDEGVEYEDEEEVAHGDEMEETPFDDDEGKVIIKLVNKGTIKIEPEDSSDQPEVPELPVAQPPAALQDRIACVPAPPPPPPPPQPGQFVPGPALLRQLGLPQQPPAPGRLAEPPARRIPQPAPPPRAFGASQAPRQPSRLSRQVEISHETSSEASPEPPSRARYPVHVAEISTWSMAPNFAAGYEDASDDSILAEDDELVRVASRNPDAAARAAAILKENEQYVLHGYQGEDRVGAVTLQADQSLYFDDDDGSREITRAELLEHAEEDLRRTRRGYSEGRSGVNTPSPPPGADQTFDTPVAPGGWRKTPKRKRPSLAEELSESSHPPGERPFSRRDWSRFLRVCRKEYNKVNQENASRAANESASWTPWRRAPQQLEPGTLNEAAKLRVVDAFIRSEGLQESDLEGEWSRDELFLRIDALKERLAKGGDDSTDSSRSVKRPRVEQVRESQPQPPSTLKRALNWMLGTPQAPVTAKGETTKKRSGPRTQRTLDQAERAESMRTVSGESGAADFLRARDETFDIGDASMMQSPSRPVTVMRAETLEHSSQRGHRAHARTSSREQVHSSYASSSRHRQQPSLEQFDEYAEYEPEPEPAATRNTAQRPSRWSNGDYRFGVNDSTLDASSSRIYPSLPDRRAALARASVEADMPRRRIVSGDRARGDLDRVDPVAIPPRRGPHGTPPSVGALVRSYEDLPALNAPPHRNRGRANDSTRLSGVRRVSDGVRDGELSFGNDSSGNLTGSM